MHKLLTGNVIFGCLLLLGSVLYMAGYGPVTFVPDEKPVVGKFVSVTPTAPKGETRPAGLFELALEARTAAPQAAEAGDQPVLGELDRLQVRRDLATQPKPLIQPSPHSHDALGRSLTLEVPTRPSLSQIYRESTGQTPAHDDPIHRLEANRS